MLAAHQRLRRADDFATTVRRGRRAARDGLVVHVLAPPDGDKTAAGPATPSRVGFVVPKGVGRAVVRNRVRRRLRHLMRDELAGLQPGTDVVVRVLPEAADRTSAELRTHLRGALVAASRPRAGSTSPAAEKEPRHGR